MEQLNQITSYMDASQVYGSSSEEQRALRTFRQGSCFFIFIPIVSAIIELIILTLLGVDAAGKITGGELALST